MAPRIRALDEGVVHKIAAGEIVVSPANALKELIENSLDAGASNIDVVVKEGGHKLLQITDNGQGIEKDDLAILAQRFTTSKITTFEDLQTVSTLGFRGEALASISHIAHLTVKTKTPEAKLATLAVYQDGELLHSKHMAGNTGTQVSVEDLFFNLPQRAKALRASSDSVEYKKVLDVVSRYAIQYPGSFSCRKWQDPQPVVIPGTDQKEKIRKVFGSPVFQELQELIIPPNESIGLLGATGWITGLNFSKRGTPFVFFINNRLVSSEPLARGIRKVYATYMPRGDSYPFVFLSLIVESENLDVNVHPTKREVQFLHEQEIVEEICSGLERLLTAGDSGRDFRVQSYITSTHLPTPKPIASSRVSSGGNANASTVNSLPAPRYEYKLVRTDPKQQTIASFSQRTHQPQPLRDSTEVPVSSPHSFQQPSSEGSGLYEDSMESVSEISEDANSNGRPNSSEARDLHLTSVRTLIQEEKSKVSTKLLQLLSEHTFVGIIDEAQAFAAIQHDVQLYLVKYNDVVEQLVYQIGLQDIGNFGTIYFGDGIPLPALLEMVGMDLSGMDELTAMTSMLEDYFRISIKNKSGEWRLEQLPLIVPGYTPPLSRYPQFIADLTKKVDWEDEIECLRSILKALAALHVPSPTETSNEQVQLLFDAVKTSLVPSHSLLPSVIEIANLPGLYRVFERC